MLIDAVPRACRGGKIRLNAFTDAQETFL